MQNALSTAWTLLLERNADQMSSASRYIHLCFQARMSDEPRLAPHPGPLSYIE